MMEDEGKGLHRGALSKTPFPSLFHSCLNRTYTDTPVLSSSELTGPHFATVIAQRLKAEGEEPKVRIAVLNSA